jgi:hypothetical protein
VLQRFHVIFDWPNRRMLLAPGPDVNHPFPANCSGLSLEVAPPVNSTMPRPRPDGRRLVLRLTGYDAPIRKLRWHGTTKSLPPRGSERFSSITCHLPGAVLRLTLHRHRMRRHDRRLLQTSNGDALEIRLTIVGDNVWSVPGRLSAATASRLGGVEDRVWIPFSLERSTCTLGFRLLATHGDRVVDLPRGTTPCLTRKSATPSAITRYPAGLGCVSNLPL